MRLTPRRLLAVVAALLATAPLTALASTADTISGHSLKHLTAALAAWPVIAALRPQRKAGPPATLRQNAPGRAA